jgi:hypothetical protein
VDKLSPLTITRVLEYDVSVFTNFCNINRGCMRHVSIIIFRIELEVCPEFSESCLGLGKTKAFLNES